MFINPGGTKKRLPLKKTKFSKINQQAVAEATGVSRSTVSFALNERLASRVNPETRMHILRTAERLGYRPNRLAQTMRSGRSNMIGLIHYMGMLQSVIERVTYAAGAIQKGGYHPYPVDMHWFPEREALSLDFLLGVNVDGLIVSDTTASLRRALSKTNIPKVYLAEYANGVPYVCSDLVQGMHDLTRHALSLGHRKLTLVLPCNHHDQHREDSGLLFKREHGFVQALESAGGKVHYVKNLAQRKETAIYTQFLDREDGISGCVVFCPVIHSMFNPYQAGSDMMHQIAKHRRLPDISLFSNDDLALGAMDYCRRNAIAIPEQMAITGFDNTAAGRIAPIALTTVEQPNQAIAEQAAALLIQLINGEQLSSEECSITIPCVTVVRASCGANLRRSQLSS